MNKYEWEPEGPKQGESGMNKPESITEAQRWHKDGYAAAIEDAARLFHGANDTLFTGRQIIDVIKALLSRGSR